MNLIDDDDLNAAIPIYLGVGQSPFPKEDATRLTARFGAERADELVQRIDRMLTELDAIKPDWSAHSLASGSTWAVEQLRASRPELNADASAALVWAFSYWWK